MPGNFSIFSKQRLFGNADANRLQLLNVLQSMDVEVLDTTEVPTISKAVATLKASPQRYQKNVYVCFSSQSMGYYLLWRQGCASEADTIERLLAQQHGHQESSNQSKSSGGQESDSGGEARNSGGEDSNSGGGEDSNSGGEDSNSGSEILYGSVLPNIDFPLSQAEKSALALHACIRSEKALKRKSCQECDKLTKRARLAEKLLDEANEAVEAAVQDKMSLLEENAALRATIQELQSQAKSTWW